MIEVDAPALLQRLGLEFRRRGRQLVAPCPYPFHHADGSPDRDPSWAMRNDPGERTNGHSLCLGCGRGGSAADLVSALLGLDDRAARAWLRSGECLRPQDLPTRVVVSIKRCPTPFKLPDGVRFAPLGEWPTAARAYLARRRVTADQVVRWGLGYAVEGRLAMRVVVPARCAAGRVVSFVARSFLDPGDGRYKRYLEPRAEDGADKAAILGEHLWPAVKLRRVLLVAEGFFDAAALERAATESQLSVSVAALHGSPSPRQEGWDSVLGRLSTFPTLAVAVDPNDAGERLFRDLRDSLSRHCVVLPVRSSTLDAASYAEHFGDTSLGAVVRAALATESRFRPAQVSHSDPTGKIRSCPS
jgi:hypothetical protein